MSAETVTKTAKNEKSGRFAPGNPGGPGRPPGSGELADFRAWCRDSMNNRREEINRRIDAEIADINNPCVWAKMQLEQGFGKPKITVDANVSTSGPLQDRLSSLVLGGAAAIIEEHRKEMGRGPNDGSEPRRVGTGSGGTCETSDSEREADGKQTPAL